MTGLEGKRARAEQFRLKQEQAQAEYEAEQKAVDEHNAKIDAFKANLKPGQTMAEIEAVFGKPDKIEFFQDTLVHWYDDAEDPIFLQYKKGKLVGKIRDVETPHNRAMVEAAREGNQMRLRELQSQTREIERANKAAAWQALGQTMQNINTQNQLQNIQYQQRQQSYEMQRMQNQNNNGRVRVNH